MALDGRTGIIIFSSVILIVGIIHLGVGIGIVAKYRQYHDVFREQVGLSGYNIVIGLLTIIISILGLISALNESFLFSRITAVAAFILGILTLASLIAALALSAHSATHFRDSITDNMNKYIQDEDSVVVMDQLQTTYECCGVNLWLDWARIQLGVSSEVVGRRRRQISSSPVSSLIQALRQKRQILTPGSGLYNLPTSYSINLPLSCCKDGGSSVANSLGAYCVFNSNGGANSFYLRGCLEPVSNIGFSQITGIAVINTCLTILAFVYFEKLLTLFREEIRSNSEQPSQNEISLVQQQQGQYPYGQYYTNYKQSSQNGMNQGQQQQYLYGQYYLNNINPSLYYTYSTPSYKTYL